MCKDVAISMCSLLMASLVKNLGRTLSQGGLLGLLGKVGAFVSCMKLYQTHPHSGGLAMQIHNYNTM